ncbi:MAG: hypothetical protein Q4D98_04600 [Planctomycetia bacterium]|nr:hypothetical protein [Planctomycetia bacterium]
MRWGFLLYCFPTLLWAASDSLTAVRWDTLPEDKMAVLENLDKLSFPELDRFRTLHGEQMVRDGEIFLPVHAICRRYLEQLQGAKKEAWDKWMDEAIRLRLGTRPCSGITLQKWRYAYPGKIPAENIPEPSENLLPHAQVFQVSLTRIQNANGQVIFQDLLPEELWGTLLPSRKWDEKENPRREIRATTSPLVCRMGTNVVVWPDDEREMRPQGYLVALDLNADGRLLWLAEPESPDWAFVGKPCRVRGNFWVPMVALTTPRRFYLAAFDADTGTPVARTFLFHAETHGTVLHVPLTHDATTLTVKIPGMEIHVSAETGQILWGKITP